LVPRDSHARNFRYFEAAVSGLGVFTHPEDKAAIGRDAGCLLMMSAFTTKETRLRLDFGSNNDRFVPILLKNSKVALHEFSGTMHFSPR
jgi:hypothetical protein